MAGGMRPMILIDAAHRSQKTFDVSRLFSQLKTTLAAQPGLPTLFFSSHDMSRMISRFGENERDTGRALAVLALQLTVSGVPFIFQGEELGVTDYRPQTAEQLFDIQGKTHYCTALAAGSSPQQALALAIEHSRDGSRAPLPWRDAPFGGFSSVAPWMPVGGDIALINAERQQQDETSFWHQYRRLIALRRRVAALHQGQQDSLDLTDECVWFTRSTTAEQVWVAINFGAPVRNPWQEIEAEVLYGEDAQWIGKNQCLIKRRVHGQAQ